VHRDVNPSNIFLTHSGEVKLFDFGLAKANGSREHSTAGVVKGKLPYLSPEQVTQTPIDGRSDVFALGATMWELTTMRRLFTRDSDVETLLAVKAALVPDPRARLATYPEELWRIVKHALERDPADRYATAADFGRALDAFALAHGRDVDMPALLGAILEELFPGERKKQAMWLRRTSGPRTDLPRGTMAPPAPVAGSGGESMRAPPPPPGRKPKSVPSMRARKPSSRD
jgi:serine/threonine protein kinase